MKRTRFCVLALLLLSALVLAGRAQKAVSPEERPGLTAQELLGKLNSPEEKMYALGYIAGVYSVYLNQDIAPGFAQTEKIAEVVKKYFEENKEKLDQPAYKLLEEVFDKKFRAKNQGGSGH
jgi:hypothetical protein